MKKMSPARTGTINTAISNIAILSIIPQQSLNLNKVPLNSKMFSQLHPAPKNFSKLLIYPGEYKYLNSVIYTLSYSKINNIFSLKEKQNMLI